MTVCLSTAKHSHPTREAAGEALRSLKKRAPHYNGHVFYRQECAGFHIGRKKQRGRLMKDVRSKRRTR